MAAGFVAPGPEVVDSGGAGGGDGGVDVVGVLGAEAEALDPDLGLDAGGGRLLGHPFGDTRSRTGTTGSPNAFQ